MHYFLKWIKFSVIKAKHLKNTGKVREFCQSGKVGTLDVHGGWHVWPGGGGACVAGEMATAVGSIHSTGMHSCFLGFFLKEECL